MASEDAATERRFADLVVERMQMIAPVTARAMFGGYGIYLDGLMFALTAYETLYFKVDDSNRPDYEAAGSGPFMFEKQGRPVAMSYYELPDGILDDPDELGTWLHAAHAVAVRAKQGRRPRRSRS